jgi:hypothetical protein
MRSLGVFGLVIFVAISASPVEARNLILSCTERTIELPEENPLTWIITIDFDHREIVDMGGERWVLDSLSETAFSAHLDSGNWHDKMTINRITGGIDRETVLQLKLSHTLHYTGLCREIQRKF